MAKMKKVVESRQGFILPFAGTENYELGRKFLEDPETFLRNAKLRLSDLECPPEVHAAMLRSKAFVEAVEAIGSAAADLKSLESIKEVAAKHFGKNFEVATIPFGLKFRERLQPMKGGDWTVTGSGTITFLDSDADVDE